MYIKNIHHHVQGCTNPGHRRVRWRLIFVGPHYETCCISPLCRPEFGVAPRCLENLCALVHVTPLISGDNLFGSTFSDTFNSQWPTMLKTWQQNLVGLNKHSNSSISSTSECHKHGQRPDLQTEREHLMAAVTVAWYEVMKTQKEIRILLVTCQFGFFLYDPPEDTWKALVRVVSKLLPVAVWGKINVKTLTWLLRLT
jgi:hypothetical protein